MYAGAARRGLGELVPMELDPLVDVVEYDERPGPDLTMTPTVIDTTVHTLPAPLVFQPVGISPQQIPQQLPPIVVAASPGGLSVMSIVWLGVLLYGTYVVLASHRRGR